ncbi:putative phosphatase regulatory subunit [Ancylostoma ceylanicum]|uniref:Putative phosphatase regulatory subunit n=1 Tax=Ancylostoma ceylanicum TaxID=53326 RepID=A0A0D6LLU6_9BILA|nr:putative phosphatase regulatory subunit [Ancylostoma ceylanicum]
MLEAALYLQRYVVHDQRHVRNVYASQMHSDWIWRSASTSLTRNLIHSIWIISSFPTPPSSPTPEHRLILTNFVYRTESEYNQRAHDDFVCLAKLRAQGRTIVGQINVANIAFTKEVAIRYTTNDWASYDEVAASYGHNVFGANNVDAFVFSLMLPTDMKDGQCQFCVRFGVEGHEYWDNNGGANYRVNMVQDVSSPSHGNNATPSPPKPSTHSVTSTSSFFTPRRLRRWGRAQEESDDESSRVYIPRRRVL